MDYLTDHLNYFDKSMSKHRYFPTYQFLPVEQAKAGFLKNTGCVKAVSFDARP